MRLRDTGRWLLRRWPIVGGAFLLAVFGAGLYLGFSDSDDIVAEPWPTPDVVFNTPSWEDWKQAFIEVTPIDIEAFYTPTPEGISGQAAPAPRTQTEAEYFAALKKKGWDRVIYFSETDTIFYLPEGFGRVGESVLPCPPKLPKCPSRPRLIIVSEGSVHAALLGPDG